MPGTASVGIRDRAGELRQIPRSGIIRAARRVKELADDEARRATGDGTMSGFGRRGARLRTRDQISGSGAFVFATVRALPVGPWVILNDGAAAHLVGIGRTRGKAPSLAAGYRRKRTYLLAPGYAHPVIGPVFHPGTKPGKGTWRRVRARTERVIPAMFADDIHRIMK
jgi:hypothetical protein